MKVKEIFSLSCTPPRKLKSDKKGQGALTTTILGAVVLSTLVASATSWYLSMQGNISKMDNSLEAMMIAQNEYSTLSHMSMEDLEKRKDYYTNGYDVGSNYTITFNLGEKGSFKDGSCKTSGLSDDDERNCYANTNAVVKDKQSGKVLYTTRTTPIVTTGAFDGLLGDYVEIGTSGTVNQDGFIVAGGSRKPSMSIKVNGIVRGHVVGRSYGTGTIGQTVPIHKGDDYEITGPCDYAYFIPFGAKKANAVSSHGDLNSGESDTGNDVELKYDASTNTIKGYVNGEETPFASQGGSGSGFPDYSNAYVLKSWNKGYETVVAPENGWIYIWDGNRTVDISSRQSNEGYPNVTMIGIGNVTEDRYYSSIFNEVSRKIFVPTVATIYNGYASSIIPVSKNQSITVFSIEDDGCWIWFIPVKK